MKSIVFISINQFGYNTDLMKYSEYLADDFKVYYLCINSGLPKIESDKVELIYINKIKTGYLTRIQLLLNSIKFIRKIKPEFVFVKYFANCSLLLPFYKKKRILLDIRTATIHNDYKIRRLKDKILSIEANFFSNISVISDGLIKKLNLNPEKTFVLPLGADKLINTKRNEKIISLLYVGILDYRDIEVTILGFDLFYRKYKDIIQCNYTIVGYGYIKEYEDTIINTIKKYKLENVVHFVGRKKYSELETYFKNHNIGVSYIPITEYFQYQPPTKTYEYLQNGLICIATNTIENSKVINERNGILINEGAENFYNGLEFIYNNLENYCPENIMEDSEKYSWARIVNNVLKPKILSIIGDE